MPRSSRHKSHKESRYSSRDVREHSDSEEDVKMKDRNGKEEGFVRVSRDSGSSEKRKLSSGKGSLGHGNEDTSEEYVGSKRRKEKADGSASDRWHGGEDERGDDANMEKEMKGENLKIDAEKGSKSKTLIDLKSKSSRRHDNGGEKKEEDVGSAAEKEESKSSSKVDSKRKSEKDSGRKEVQQHKDIKESRVKERGFERERKIHDIKHETDSRAVEGEISRKQGSHSVDFVEERQSKRGRENTESLIQDDLHNAELEKEFEKRTSRRRDGSDDKDKCQGDAKEIEHTRVSLRGERSKDGKYKEEKHKDGSYGDKYREGGDRDNSSRDDKYREEGDRNSKYKDDKYYEDGERDNRHRDDKYREDGDRANRHRDDKYREDGDRVSRHRGDKYREDGDRHDRHRDDKYHEDGYRDDRHRDDRYLEDGNRDARNREEWEDFGRDGRHRDGKQRDDSDKDKRLQDVKYRVERSSRDHTSEKSDVKRLRDESNAAELHYRKTNNRDGSPIYDDRSTRYKDDKGRRRNSDKEDHGDTRSRSTKEQPSDAAKRSMSSTKMESASDRGRSSTRNAELEITPSHSRRKSSPKSGSHALKDHYRILKQEESKYRDHTHDERVRYVSSGKEFSGVARSIEKSLQKDNSHLGDLSAEKRVKSDAPSSPMQLVDKSPSSTSRRLNRSDVKRSLDIEDSGQRVGGLKDGKDYSGRGGRVSGELLGDDLQAAGDTLSVSSPFSGTGHLSSNPRSFLLPAPSFRMGADSPLAFEEDNRGKSNNRHRRIGDPNMGRLQGSPWRGVPNWPSPMANGFLPFQQGPPHMGFHPMVQQFPAPPIFNVRPSMDFNQAGFPYHVGDGDRFSGHGRPLGWRNPSDSCAPPIHGWDVNNAVFGDESHIYGRSDWDHKKDVAGGRAWETSGDVWKGQNSGGSTELQSALQKEDYSAGEVSVGQSDLVEQNDEKQPGVLDEGIETDKLGDAPERNTLEAPKTIPEDAPDLSRKDGACHSHIYLSMLDISSDLTQSELYSQYTSLMGMDQSTYGEEDDSKILIVENVTDDKGKISCKTSSASLFPAINDSISKKALSLYKKLREELRTHYGDKDPVSVVNLQHVPTSEEDVVSADDDKPGMVLPACDQEVVEGAVSALNKVKIAHSPVITNEKIDEPVGEESEFNRVKMELDTVVTKQESVDYICEDKLMGPENVEPSDDARSPGKVEEVSQGKDDPKVDHSDPISNNEGQKLLDAKCGQLLFSDLSSVPSQAVMPELIESGSVNLSRIHQSPESTH